jgi:hypothetical protein
VTRDTDYAQALARHVKAALEHYLAAEQLLEHAAAMLDTKVALNSSSARPLWPPWPTPTRYPRLRPAGTWKPTRLAVRRPRLGERPVRSAALGCCS